MGASCCACTHGVARARARAQDTCACARRVGVERGGSRARTPRSPQAFTREKQMHIQQIDIGPGRDYSDAEAGNSKTASLPVSFLYTVVKVSSLCSTLDLSLGSSKIFWIFAPSTRTRTRLPTISVG